MHYIPNKKRKDQFLNLSSFIISSRTLFQEERECNQHNDKEARKRANAFEVFLDHGVVGVEISVAC